MATKTISLKMDAYNRLRSARRFPTESFSQVVLRARWPEETVTGAELLARCRRSGAYFSAEELNRIEEAKREDLQPEDKWKDR
ncbi:MAG: antitoxin VapB family protein [Acidobacteriota bacterium]